MNGPASEQRPLIPFLMNKLIILLVLIGTALAQNEPSEILPTSFAGWQKAGDARRTTDSANFDPKNAAALKEYGFTDTEVATYTRADRTISVKAARFADATGGFGGFTFYLSPQMDREQLCDGGASGDTRVLFYCGNILLDITLDRVTAMSGAEMREFAAAMPKLAGNLANKPTLPLYLPREMRDQAKFALGPASLAASGSPVPPGLIDFGRSAEVAISKFDRIGASGVTTLMSYPTPAIATAQLKKIQDWGEAKSKEAINASGQNTLADPAPMPTFAAKRTGSMVAVVTGDIDARQAQSILADINYDADVTWSEPTGMGKRENIGNLVYQIFVLIGIILGITLVIGFLFGGFRVMLKNAIAARRGIAPEEAEFIKLNLRD